MLTRATNKTFGVSVFNCLLRNLLCPALIPLRATIRPLPTTTINIVKADLAFLSLSASNDSMNTCLMFLWEFPALRTTECGL